MSFDWWTFGLQTVNAVVLVWLLARFLFRPVAGIIAERQAAAHAALDQAQADRAAAAEALAETQKAKDALAADRATLITEARAEADRQKQQILAEARADADKARADAAADLDRQRAAETQHWHAEAATLAVDISARLLDQLPGGARAVDFVPGLIDAVSKLPKATQDRIGTEGPAIVRSAKPLTGDEQALVADQLQATLGRAVPLTFITDDSLIAGLELDTPHAVVRNTFRSDLDRIAGRIAPDD
ncbi:F0F1 ATP synthase subunit delta [Chachezhania sediminis]|uniref:F0F1 ATP synthase subunit delta n=1 Tax=Chachezhania sediminis TaxID=2599291 RepID=UPI00131EA3D1|nr:F0F1 ATP synthase subunit delta [Chachezhania sediminis]